MDSEDKVLNIYQRINAVMQKIDYLKKDKAVTGGGANYTAVTHDAVTAALREHLVEAGIVVNVDTLKSEMLIKRDLEKQIKMHLYSADFCVHFVNMDDPKDRVSVTVNAHAADNGDKAPGKAMSYATKYAMLKTFSIETGEDDESRAYEAPEFTEEQKRQFDELLEAKDGLGFIVFSKTVGPQVMMGLNGSFEQGKVSQGKKLCKDLDKAGWDQLKETAHQIGERLDAQDPSVIELTDELSKGEKGLLMNLLDQYQVKKLADIKAASV